MRGGPPRRRVELSSWPAPMAADGAPGNGAATAGSLGPGTGETRGPATDLLDGWRRWRVIKQFDGARSARARRVINAAHTSGERAADAVAGAVGSWRFIIIQSCLLVAWMALNIVAFARHWDPYPFILLNL